MAGVDAFAYMAADSAGLVRLTEGLVTGRDWKTGLRLKAGERGRRVGSGLVSFGFYYGTVAVGAKGAFGKAQAPSRTVIGKMKDVENLGPGENTLLKHMPNQGTPKLNWQQNSSVLRTEMNKGLPMRDASVDSAGKWIPETNTGFLKAERNLLQEHGWTYNPETRLWNPPAAK
jgi:hypothetical protein